MYSFNHINYSAYNDITNFNVRVYKLLFNKNYIFNESDVLMYWCIDFVLFLLKHDDIMKNDIK